MIARMRYFVLVLITVLFSMTLQAQDAPVVRAITHLAGDVYRFQNNQHYSVFMVTPEGVIATDPISLEAARWLNNEIQQRFQQPVKYVVYSHDHADHASGAAGFPDATIVAHVNTLAPIAAGNQGVEAVATPDITFSSELTLRLGGSQVHMYYLGTNHSDNLVFMEFPAEKILFAVDAVSINRLPFEDFSGTDIDGLIGALTAVEQMDIAIVVPGHGKTGTLADVSAHREYIEGLKDQVTEMLREGSTDGQIMAAINMEQYSQWESYDQWQKSNVRGMIAYVKSHYRF